MPKGKKDGKPSGRRSAYAFFVQSYREELRKQRPDEKVTFPAFTKACSEKWKFMVGTDRKPFQEMAERDKKRYEQERDMKPKQTQDPNKPIRPLSAFFWFCNDERPKVKGLNPDYGAIDMSMELGRLWRKANPETKRRYETMAARDKARYEKEITAYKRLYPTPPPVVYYGVFDDVEEEEDDDDGYDDD